MSWSRARHLALWGSLLLFPHGSGAGSADVADGWRSLEPGLELRRLVANEASPVGDSAITVVRVDPHRFELCVVGLHDSDLAGGRTARQWATSADLVAAINAGMFATDHRTHLGYLESAGVVSSPRVNHYQSVTAFHPRDPALAPFRLFDLDAGATIEAIRRDYRSVVQNLRLIKRPGENRWSPQPKRWSEAALGEDAEGRVLFVFSRSPFSMRDLNRELLAAGLGLQAAQHLEGGPEAQLYLRTTALELDLFGSYETSFYESDANAAAWPIPNVIGVRRRQREPIAALADRLPPPPAHPDRW